MHRHSSMSGKASLENYKVFDIAKNVRQGTVVAETAEVVRNKW